MAPVVKVFKALYTLISLTLPVVFLAQNVASQDAAPLYGDGNAPDVVVDTSADAATFHGLAIEAEVEGSLPDLTFDTASTGTELSAPASVGIDRRADGAADFFLRIMPLGASITQGYASTDGNGYRKHLRDRLRFAGWKVNSKPILTVRFSHFCCAIGVNKYIHKAPFPQIPNLYTQDEP